MSDQSPFPSQATVDNASYDVMGPPDGFPLVFLHAGALTRKMWLPQIDKFSDTFRVMVPDLPGHGIQASTTFQLDKAAREVANIISWEAEGPAIVIGLSLGGYVAMRLVQQYPEHIAGLVLADCSAKTWGLRGLAMKTRGLLLASGIPPLEQALIKSTEKTLRKILPETVAKPQIEAGFYWKGAGQGLWDLGGKQLQKKLLKYRGPVLILNGENDKSSRKGELDLLADIPDANARIETIEKAGHIANLEQPQEFTKAVRDFVESVYVW